MHYLDEGAGPPLILQHGNPTWSFLYRDVIAGLRDRADAEARAIERRAGPRGHRLGPSRTNYCLIGLAGAARESRCETSDSGAL